MGTSRDLHIAGAALVGLCLVGGSLALVSLASSPTQLGAVIGGTGAAVGSALIILTGLTWWWRSPARAYVETAMEDPQAPDVGSMGRDPAGEDAAAS